MKPKSNWFKALVTLMLVILTAVPALAATNQESDPTGGNDRGTGTGINITTDPLAVTWGAVKTLTYTDARTAVDLDGDGQTDIKVSPSQVTSMSSDVALQYNQKYWDLYQVTTVERTGYVQTVPTDTNRVLVVQLPNDVYAKIRLKVTATTIVTFDVSIGTVTTSDDGTAFRTGSTAQSGLPPITVAVAATADGDRTWSEPLPNGGGWTVYMDPTAKVGVKIDTNKLTAVNGARIQYLRQETDFNGLSRLPVNGYADSADLMDKAIYAISLPGGKYAKLQYWVHSPASPGYTGPDILYVVLTPAGGNLTVRATSNPGDITLLWNALTDASLGYNIYRWESGHTDAASATRLNDLPVLDRSYDDYLADANKSYIYVVSAVKDDGENGSYTSSATTTAAPTPRTLTIYLKNGTATLDSGASLSLDAKPAIKNGRIMVPASLLAKAGFTVTTDAAAGKITLSRFTGATIYTMTMNLGAVVYTTRGGILRADAAPYLEGNVFMVPIKTVANALKLDIVCDPHDRSAIVSWAE